MAVSTMQQQKVASAFMNPDMMGTCLLALLVDQYGVEVLDWDFDTIKMELADDFGVTLPVVNEDKIYAVVTAMTTDQFYREPMVFHHVATALSNEVVDFDTYEPTEPDQMAWAVFEVLSLDGKGHPSFSDEVKRYVGSCLVNFGIYHKPQTLAFADFPPGTQEQAAGVLSDDPVLYSGFHHRSTGDAAELDQYVQKRFRMLLGQLHELPLENRDNESWETLRKKLIRD